MCQLLADVARTECVAMRNLIAQDDKHACISLRYVLRIDDDNVV